MIPFISSIVLLAHIVSPNVIPNYWWINHIKNPDRQKKFENYVKDQSEKRFESDNHNGGFDIFWFNRR